MEIIKFAGQEYRVLFPDLSKYGILPLGTEELEGLRASIKKYGKIFVPVVVDENHGIIDGANRLRTAVEFGLKGVPIVFQMDLTPEAKEQLAVSLNADRRQMSPDGRKQLREARIVRVAEARAEGKSTRQIAQEVGVSQPQVLKDLKDGAKANLSDRGDNRLSPEPAKPASAKGKGRKTPAPKPKPDPFVEKPKPPETVKGRDGKTYAAAKPKDAPSSAESSKADPVKKSWQAMEDLVGRFAREIGEQNNRVGNGAATLSKLQQLKDEIGAWKRKYVEK